MISLTTVALATVRERRSSDSHPFHILRVENFGGGLIRHDMKLAHLFTVILALGAEGRVTGRGTQYGGLFHVARQCDSLLRGFSRGRSSAVGVCGAGHPKPAQTGPERAVGAPKPEIVPSLIVTNSQGATAQGDTLTLTNVAPNVVIFADRRCARPA
jgi:hypothetical protein